MSPRPPAWRPPPQDLRLSRDAVHVWRASLDRPPPVVEAFRRTLAPDEADRAGRFRFPKDRDRFIVCRATLRSVLSRYLQTEPRLLRFHYGRYGKPALASGVARLRFNVSHSAGLALYAIALDREVGVDIEFVRDDFAVEEIAKGYFSPGEVASLSALPAGLRVEGFFNCWTRKEAYVKARGEGLSLPLSRFDVSLVPGGPAALLSVADNRGEELRWSLRGLTPGAGYAAALAVEGRGLGLACWQWAVRNLI